MRLMPRTSLTMRTETRSSTSYGILAQSAVMKSDVVTDAQCQRIIVRPAVAHDADGAHGGQDREVLVHLAVEASLATSSRKMKSASRRISSFSR